MSGLAICAELALPEPLGIGLVTGLDAGVLAQAHERGRTALGGHLVIEQAAQALENISRSHCRTAPRAAARSPAGETAGRTPCAESRGLPARSCPTPCGAPRLDCRQQRLELVPLGHLIRERRIGDALVELGQALARAALRGVLELHREQPVGIGVAALDPGLLGGRCCVSRRGRTAQRAHQNCSGQAGHSRSRSDDNVEAGDIIGNVATALRERSGARLEPANSCSIRFSTARRRSMASRF